MNRAISARASATCVGGVADGGDAQNHEPTSASATGRHARGASASHIRAYGTASGVHAKMSRCARSEASSDSTSSGATRRQ